MSGALDRTKLARVLEMIGSSFDGEALVAARRAHELVRAAGLRWEEVLDDTRNEQALRTALDACRRLLAERCQLRAELALALARIAKIRRIARMRGMAA